ncbi:MAG: hypothetical protein NMNS01_11350 [Nitrosomonas sp.]|nr:MAG: hypothetical protein NMNS01_11350 [Nitrosomonas sp.]
MKRNLESIVRQRSRQNISHEQNIIFDTHRTQVATGQLTTVNILSKDADLVANYLTNHFGKGNAQIATARRSALVHFSLPIPLNLFNVYLNFEATLIQTAALPQQQAVRIGSLVLPDFITHYCHLRQWAGYKVTLSTAKAWML